MSKPLDWCTLNEDGFKEYGDIFPDKRVPIVSIIEITFDHPKLEEPETAYLVRGEDLSKEQLDKLIEKLSERFPEDAKQKDLMRAHILGNKIPIRKKLTNSAGTRRIYAYVDFDGEYPLEEEEDPECWEDW